MPNRLLFQDSFAGVAAATLQSRGPTAVGADVPTQVGTWSKSYGVGDVRIAGTGLARADQFDAAGDHGHGYVASVACPAVGASPWYAGSQVKAASLQGEAAVRLLYDFATGNGYEVKLEYFGSVPHVVLWQRSAGGFGSRVINHTPVTPIVVGDTVRLRAEVTDDAGKPHFKVWFDVGASLDAPATLAGEATDASPPTLGTAFGLWSYATDTSYTSNQTQFDYLYLEGTVPVTPGTLIEDSFADTAGTDLSAHAPTAIAGDAAVSGSLRWGNAATAVVQTTGTGEARVTTAATAVYLAAGVTPGLNSPIDLRLDLNERTIAGNGGLRFGFDPTTGNGYELHVEAAFTPPRVEVAQLAGGSIAARTLSVAPDVPLATGVTRLLVQARDAGTGHAKLTLYADAGASASDPTTYLGEVTVTAPTGRAYGVASTASNTTYQTTLTQIDAVRLKTVAAVAYPTPGAIARGTTVGGTVNLTATAASGTTGPYTNQWHASRESGFAPGVGTAISGATGLSLAFVPSTTDAWFVKVVQTDALSVSAETAQLPVSAPRQAVPTLVTAALPTGMKWVGLGDSIMANVPPGGTLTTFQRFLAAINANSGGGVTGTNTAVSGTTITNWAAGQSYCTAAISAANTLGATDALVMLGTNDAKAQFPTNAAVYKTTLQGIVTALFAGVATLQRVWVAGSPYTTERTLWTDRSADLPRQYRAKIAEVVNGTTVRQGAAGLYDYTADDPSGWSYDGIHPNEAVGAAAVAAAWAAPVLAAFPVLVLAVSADGASPATVADADAALLVVPAGGVAPLAYAWTTPAKPSGSTPAIGSPTAASTPVTYERAGSYTHSVTATDFNGQQATGTVAVTVAQTLTVIVVTPSTATVPVGGTRQFAAAGTDQFGRPETVSPTWSVAGGGGTINSSGLYTAPGTTGSAVVRATVGGVHGDAAVTVADVTPPGVPTGVVALTGNTIVHLTWAAADGGDVAGYEVRQDGTVVYDGPLLYFTATGLTNGTAYSYTVSAYDSAATPNESAESAAVEAVPANGVAGLRIVVQRA